MKRFKRNLVERETAKELVLVRETMLGRLRDS